MTTPQVTFSDRFGLPRYWLRERSGLLILVLFLYTLVHLIWTFFPWGSPDYQHFIGTIAYLPGEIGIVALCWWASTHPSLAQSDSWRWRLLALAVLSSLVGDIIYLSYDFLLHISPYPSLADLFYLAYYPLLLSGIVLFPDTPRSQREYLSFWLDALITVIGSGMVLWYLVIRPNPILASSNAFGLALALIYPAADLVTIVAMTTFGLSQSHSQNNDARRILFLGLVCKAIGSIGYSVLVVQNAYIPGMWPDSLWVAASLLIALGVQVHIWQVSRVGATPVKPATSQPAPNLLPYIAATLGYVVLVIVTFETHVPSLQVLVFATVALTVLVIIRRDIAVRDSMQLLAARQTAEQVSQLKSQFLTIMSHELRTPLNAIINFTRFLSKERYGSLTSRQEELQHCIIANAEQLLALINDVLDMNKIQSGRLELFHEVMDLAPVLQDLMSASGELTQEKALTLTLECPDELPPVLADKTRIRQVLFNLLSNAAKFTHQGGITVRAKVTPQSTIRIEFQDTGIGIAPEHHGLIFEAFRQVQSGLRREYSGTGLGLPISKRLVEMHGGKIGVVSTAGQGATFWFTLPMYDRMTRSYPLANHVLLITRSYQICQNHSTFRISNIARRICGLTGVTTVLLRSKCTSKTERHMLCSTLLLLKPARAGTRRSSPGSRLLCCF